MGSDARPTCEPPDERAPRQPRNTRPRDALGRPLPYGSTGVGRAPSGVRRTPRETLAQAQRLFDEGLPFHAHEVLEDAWKSAPDRERALWRGLAQLAVGATHAARGNRSGAVALLRRGAAAIEAYADDPPYGIDVNAVLKWTYGAEREVTDTPTVLSAPPLVG